MPTEAWLSGPVAGVDPYLMPAAHAFLQARADVARAAADLTAEELWARPGGAASAGFHLRHLAGSTDRLLTYARGEGLSEAQRAAVSAEALQPGPETSAAPLLAAFEAAVEAALSQLRATPREALLQERKVGRAGLPSTVLGLLFHAAEHATRHAGQLITTVKAVRGA